MARYSKPVWQMVKEAIEELGDLTGPTAAQYIHDHYPRDNVKRNTIQLQLIACSVNHRSAKQFDDPNRFLWYLGNGHYRVFDPNADEAELSPSWKIIQVTQPRPREAMIEDVLPFSRVETGHRIIIPSVVAQGLDIAPSDIVAFVEEQGKYYIRKGHLKIEVD